MKIGITGHQDIDNPEWVADQIRQIIKIQQQNSIVGISSLAIGADQIFAKVVLEMDGQLEVIIPMPNYEDKFDTEGKREYTYLLTRSSSSEVLHMDATEEEAYLAAGKKVVDKSDLVIVVWNGKPATGLGGTGDIINYARKKNKTYFHINPNTKEIESCSDGK